MHFDKKLPKMYLVHFRLYPQKEKVHEMKGQGNREKVVEEDKVQSEKKKQYFKIKIIFQARTLTIWPKAALGLTA